MHHRMRAEHIVEPQMRALVEQVEIEVGNHRPEPVGIVELDLVLAVAHAQAIGMLLVGNRPGEQSDRVNARQLGLSAAGIDHRNAGGIRQEGAHHRLAVLAMPAEIGERIGMSPGDHRLGIG